MSNYLGARIRVAFVESDVIFRTGLRALLEPRSDFEWVGEAQSLSDFRARYTGVGIQVIMKCGLFIHDYELWQQEHDKSWLNFKIFWKSRARIKKKTVRAGQLGYGMNAEEVPTTEDNRLFEQSVDQFGQAHAATQAAIESLTTNNANLTNNVAASVSALQQQMNAIQSSLQNLAMAGVNRAPSAPPAAPQQAYQQPPQNKFQRPPQNQAPPQQYYPPPQFQQQQQYQPPNYQGGRRSGSSGGRGGERGGCGGHGGYQ